MVDGWMVDGWMEALICWCGPRSDDVSDDVRMYISLSLPSSLPPMVRSDLARISSV